MLRLANLRYAAGPVGVPNEVLHSGLFTKIDEEEEDTTIDGLILKDVCIKKLGIESVDVVLIM